MKSEKERFLIEQSDNNDHMFYMVEIEINSRCNRQCSYCPNAIAPRQAPKFMSIEQFKLILSRLMDVQFTGRISYHFYNEPLLHPHLSEFVSLTQLVLPKCRQVLYSNGDYLTEEKYRDLLVRGIQRFIVTQHDGELRPEWEKVTLLVPQQLELTNRGGIVNFGPAPPDSLRCTAPATMLIVTVTGNVLLCYEDARETQIMGNVNDDDLRSIWNSTRFKKLRASLLNGNRSQTDICRKCNNCGHNDIVSYDYIL